MTTQIVCHFNKDWHDAGKHCHRLKVVNFVAPKPGLGREFIVQIHRVVKFSIG